MAVEVFMREMVLRKFNTNAKLSTLKPVLERVDSLRLVYTSDFRAQFRSKLVRSSEYNYFYILENGLV